MFTRIYLPILLVVSTVFSQEAIKFQIPTDSSGALIPVVLPTKPDTIQKLGIASNRPLNLAELSVKDTASFETYSRRLSLVQDSISASNRLIESVKKNTLSFMPELEPKSEFEKQAEYDARKAKWDKELYDRTERDTKSLSIRLAELEKAKKKIEENQVSLYSSVNIKSVPENASIWIGVDEIGTTPAEYNYLIPDIVKISIRKEGYNSWDTTFAVPSGGGGKHKISVVLEEKSIFSTENEINFGKLLSKDTTVEGYESRIGIIKARKIQVGEEIKKILEDFANSYPPLEAQKPDETPDAFNKRRDSWTREGMRQVAEFQKKHKNYEQKLDYSIDVLNDYIISTESTIISEPSFGATIELGSYDADKEQFELTAQDSSSGKSPFYFKGYVGIPRDTAKVMDRAVPGFVTSLQYINFPFKTDSANVNLAMSKLLLSRNGLDLKVDGSFGEIERYKSQAGYDVWKLHADSLLSGSLKPKGLTWPPPPPPPPPSPPFNWCMFTRVVAFTATAVLGGFAVYKHIEAQDKIDKMKKLKKDLPSTDPDEEKEWKVKYNEAKDSAEKNEFQRNIFGGIAGAFAVGGIVTFFF